MNKEEDAGKKCPVKDMSAKIDLLRDSPVKLFGHYLIPAVSASLVTSIYILADTIMVGRGVGAEALAALNLILPLFSVMFGIGMLFGVGGGVLYSVANGSDDRERAQMIWSTSLVCISILAAVVTVVCFVFLTPICLLLGADETNLSMVREYGVFVALGAPLFIFSSFLQAFVRNDRDPKRAMAAVLTGSAINIVFDYIFIFTFHMGLAGGAAATVLGNIFSVLILVLHLKSPNNELHFLCSKVKWSAVREVVASGAPSFLIEIASAVILFSFNRQTLRYLGHMGVVAYGVIANYAIVLQSLFNGTGQAAQPVMAANFGASQQERVLAVRRMGLIVVALIGAGAAALFWLVPETLVRLFVVPDAQLLDMARPALRLYGPAFVPYGINLFLTVYLQSIVRSGSAMIIMVLRAIVLPLVFVLLLPALFGGGAIFGAVLMSECVTGVVAIILLRMIAKKEPNLSR